MTWEELLNSKGYAYIGNCCNGWRKYAPQSNTKDASKIIKIRRDRFKVPSERGYTYKYLRELEDYLNAIQ